MSSSTAKISMKPIWEPSSIVFRLQPVVLILSFWPVWIWYGERICDKSDEPLGIVALLTVAGLSWLRRSSAHNAANAREAVSAVRAESGFASNSRLSLVAVASLLILYCCLAPSVTPMILAIIAITAVGVCLAGSGIWTKPNAGDWALLGLSLPLVASLNFYVGYPLRILSSQMAASLLNLGGLAVSTRGTEILCNSSVVGIDPPCSGIKMLWVTLYITATLASWKRLRLVPTLSLLALSLVASILANALRVSSLFYIESGIVPITGSLHTLVHVGVSAAVFLISAAMLTFITMRLSNEPRPFTTSRAEVPRTGLGVARLLPLVLVLMLSVAAAAVPFVHASPRTASASTGFTGWPAKFEGQSIREVQLADVTARYVEGFPGRVAVFMSEDSRIVFRWVTSPTRQLHPSSDCYKAGGYNIKWLPQRTDAEGHKWAAFEASKDSERLFVRERIFDDAGNNWTDASSWYWSAAFNQSQAPWWSVTVTERLP